MRLPTVDQQLASTLVLQYRVGVTPAGAPILRQKSLNNVRPDANHDDLYEVAVTLFSLSDYPLNAVILVEKTEIVEEEEE